MAIQFMNQPDNSGLYQSLGGLLGGLGGGLLGYGLGKWNNNEDQEAEDMVKAGVMTPEEYKVYKKLKTPQERTAFRTQTMKQAERRRVNSAIEQERIRREGGGGGTNTGGMTAPLENLGGPQAGPMQSGGQQFGRSNISPIESIERLRAEGVDPQTLSLYSNMWNAQEKQDLQKQQMAQKEKSEAWKATAAFRAKETEAHESNIFMQDVLKDMTQYSESGKMTHPLFLELLSKVGLDFDALKSPETVAYQALEKEFLKDLKGIFGGRISNLEMSTFLKSIPKATNTPQGRKLISERLKGLYKAKELRFKTMNRIVEENGGWPPFDLQEKVSIAMAKDKAVKAKEQQFANQFRGIPKGGELVQDEDTKEYFIQSADGKLTPYKMGV